MLQLGKTDEAESVIRRGVDVDPNNPEVRRVYGDVLLRQDKLAAALEQYERALVNAKIPSDRFYALAQMGWVHHALDNHTESTKTWAAAPNIGIVFDPVTNRRLYNMVAWNELGTGAATYARLGDFAAAIRLQEKSTSLIKSTDIPDKEKWLKGAIKRMKLHRQGIPYTEN